MPSSAFNAMRANIQIGISRNGVRSGACQATNAPTAMEIAAAMIVT